MAPILIFTDTDYYNSVIREKSAHLADLNEILTDYAVLSLPALTGAEFQQLIRDPVGTVYDKMTNGAPLTLNSFPVSRKEGMRLLTKPAGYNELLAIIESFTNHRPGWSDLLTNVDVVSNTVVLKQSVIDATTDASKVYIKTDAEKKLYDFAQAVIAAANANLGAGTNYNLAELLGKVTTTKVTPSGSFFMPVNQYSFEIVPRKFAGFGLTEWRSY